MAQYLFSSTTLDDRSPNITYAGAGAWIQTNGLDDLNDGTKSTSGVQGATATLHFYGTAIEYWGNLDNSHGPCQLTLDGVGVGSVTAYSTTWGSSIVLWYRSGLSLRDHTLIITVQNPPAANTPNKCELDRFVVNATSIVDTSSVGSITPPSPPATSSTNPAVISSTGATISALVANNANITLTTSGTSFLALPDISIPLPSGVSSTSTPLVSSISSTTRTLKSPPTSAIVGAGLGVIALLGLLFLLLWLYKRSKRDGTLTPATFDRESATGRPPRTSRKGRPTLLGAWRSSTATKGWSPITDIRTSPILESVSYPETSHVAPPAYQES